MQHDLKKETNSKMQTKEQRDALKKKWVKWLNTFG
jgi:hypothetical protein